MAIIWIGTDDTDFIRFPINLYTGSNTYRPVFSRASFQPYYDDRKWLASKKLPLITSGWFSLIMYGNSSLHFAANQPAFLSFADYASKKRIGIGTGNTAGKAAIVKSEETSTILVEENNSSLSSGMQTHVSTTKFDIQLIDYGENGTINVFMNGLPFLTYTGDIRLSGVSGFDTVIIGPFSTSTIFSSRFSELIVADEDTRKFYVKTLAPNAAGDTNEWTGAYTDIDEITYDSTDKITADADDQLFLCNMTGMPSLNRAYKVKAVKVAASLNPAYSGLGAQIGIKTNDEIHLGSVEELDLRTTIEKIYHTNPETETEFTPSEVNDLQLALYSTIPDEYEY